MSYDESKAITPDDLQHICDLVYKESAIVLTAEKAYLVEARMEPLSRREGFESTHEMIAALRKPGIQSLTLRRKVVDAMTTNETSFFRDIHPFEALKKIILPEVIARRASEKRLRIWCAACSSGQEPFTIAMLMAQNFPELADWEVTFVASDLSEDMLQKCREGTFSKLEVNRGLPAPLLVKYFEQKGTDWVLKEELRSMIDFRQVNLIGAWPVLPKMDIVFIRNVLIYFDVETKRKILGQIRKNLDPEGYLFLGGTESTLNVDDAFIRLRVENSTCYTLVDKSLATPEVATTAG